MQWLIVGALLAATGVAARADVAPAVSGSAAGSGAPAADDAKLEQEIRRELGSSPATAGAADGAAPAGPVAPPASAGSPAASTASGSRPGTGGNPLARVMMLPDVSAIGSFAGAYDTLDVAQLSPRSGSYGDPHKHHADLPGAGARAPVRD